MTIPELDRGKTAQISDGLWQEQPKLEKVASESAHYCFQIVHIIQLLLY